MCQLSFGALPRGPQGVLSKPASSESLEEGPREAGKSLLWEGLLEKDLAVRESGAAATVHASIVS